MIEKCMNYDVFLDNTTLYHSLKLCQCKRGPLSKRGEKEGRESVAFGEVGERKRLAATSPSFAIAC